MTRRAGMTLIEVLAAVVMMAILTVLVLDWLLHARRGLAQGEVRSLAFRDAVAIARALREDLAQAGVPGAAGYRLAGSAGLDVLVPPSPARTPVPIRWRWAAEAGVTRQSDGQPIPISQHCRLRLHEEGQPPVLLVDLAPADHAAITWTFVLSSF